MIGIAPTGPEKSVARRKQSASVAIEWSHPYSPRGAVYRTPARTISGRAVPIRCRRIVSRAMRPTSVSSMASSRLANSCGRTTSFGGSATSTLTTPFRISTG